MAPFRFRLQSVLQLREHETRMAQQALGAAEQTAKTAREGLDQARNNRLSYAQAVEIQRRQGMTVLEWRAAAVEQERLTNLEQEAGEFYHQALIQVKEKRHLFDEARRREKTLEKLREGHQEQHRVAELAAEQVVLDEISQQLYRRQVKGAQA